jgi:DNA-binding MarR family transcriptional regulator/GNAT superfamily N-acetyltransferase
MLIEEKVDYIRSFYRFFTRQIGVLGEGYLQSPFSLTQARILFEIANQKDLTAAELGRELGLDAGYLSRSLAHLEQKGLIVKTRTAGDARQRLLSLSPEGQEAFMLLNNRSHDDVLEMLKRIDPDSQQKMIQAMRTIQRITPPQADSSEAIFLRDPQPGDMGWVIQRHGQYYANVYGWDQSFEILVAQIVADLLAKYNPVKEHIWIAEMGGEVVGSIFLVQASEKVAKLRLLFVEPHLHGRGLGSRLVEECIRFARRCGYQKITLWTNHVLKPARHIYQKNGFRIISQEEKVEFGQLQIEETWELDL